jgi:ribosomal protein L34E
MIRSKSLKMIKLRTPGNRRVIRYIKRSKKSLLKLHSKVKREMLKGKVRK